MQNSKVHFYIRINLEKSGSARAKKGQIYGTFFGTPGKHLHYMHAVENLNGLFNQLSGR
jgi:hypothetical protein